MLQPKQEINCFNKQNIHCKYNMNAMFHKPCYESRRGPPYMCAPSTQVLTELHNHPFQWSQFTHSADSNQIKHNQAMSNQARLSGFALSHSIIVLGVGSASCHSHPSSGLTYRECIELIPELTYVQFAAAFNSF